MRLAHLMPMAAVLLTAASLGAQQPAPPSPPSERPPAAAPAPAHPPGEDEAPKFDAAAVERGKQLMVQQCGFCHGSNARGGQQGPDLTRSDLVQSDENGKQLGAFLKVGRPELKMPKFDLPEKDVVDLATFLHATIASVSDRGKYKILNIVVGDPKAGEKFFNGAGRCVACHSTTGDLKGVGAKYDDPAVLQGRLVMPRGGRPRRRGPAAAGQSVPPFLEPTAVKATITQPGGESVTAPLIRLTDFDVTVYDAATQQPRTWLRTNGVPAVVLTDPLQAHVDLLQKWTDDDIHDMTAFLATLK
jgi:cytochrome c oxidase cbb3-type subunit III